MLRLDRGVEVGEWEGMYLNMTHVLGGRNEGIYRKKSDVFRRKKRYLLVKFGSCR